MIRLIFTDFGRKRPDKRRLFVTQISRRSRSIMLQKSVKISLIRKINDPKENL